MKKLLLSISLLLISYLNYSQNSNIKFGIHAGLNYSTFYGYDIPAVFDPVYSESPAFAFLGGINIEYQIKEKLSLKLELNYERKSQKGNNNNIAIGDIDDLTQRYNFTSKKNNDYLVLPIMVKYNFGNKDSFYANGGPFIGYLLKSNITNDLGDIEGINNGTVVTTDLNNKTDFGLAIGLGKILEINEKNSISIEIRENLGLINTTKGKVWGNGEAKTNSLNLIIGYLFN